MSSKKHTDFELETSGKAGGLKKVERLKAAQPYWR